MRPPGDTLGRIADLAERQHGVVGHGQLLERAGALLELVPTDRATIDVTVTRHRRGSFDRLREPAARAGSAPVSSAWTACRSRRPELPTTVT